MQNWNGTTKTRRILLRVTEEMERTVKALAELNCRTIQDELRFRIALGLEQSVRPYRKARPSQRRQVLSTGGDSSHEEVA